MSPKLSPIDHSDLTSGVSLSDEVYARIGAAILDGTLAPGERLRDVDIATQLGISRTPVREALQRLERFGLVEVAVGRYTRVSVRTTACAVRPGSSRPTSWATPSVSRSAPQRRRNWP